MAEQKTSAKATAKTVRIPAKKARLVIDLIRNKPVAEAAAILKFTPRAASPVIEKVLMSAIANAENNFELDPAKLVVSEAYVNEGLVMKRMKFGSRGHVDPIKKRTCHITIVVSDNK